MNDLPTVRVDLHSPALRAYWLARVAQHTSDSYAGVPLSKFPEDLRVYEHLLWTSQATTVIELGAQFGGSALWLRDRLHSFARYRPGVPRVITIERDADLTRARLTDADPDWQRDITVVAGDVTDPGLPIRSRPWSQTTRAAWSSRTLHTRMRRRGPHSTGSHNSSRSAASSSWRMGAWTTSCCGWIRPGRGVCVPRSRTGWPVATGSRSRCVMT